MREGSATQPPGGPFDAPGALLILAERIAEGEGYPPASVVVQARPIAAASRAEAGLRGAAVREAISRILLGREVQAALQFLHETGMLAAWLPELEATVDFSQEAGRRHKDVWEHTKQVVRQCVPRPDVRWAALLHDIGKVPTRTFTADGGVHFHRHSEVGARMFDDIARRFDLDRPTRKKVQFLILHHLRANQYEGSWTDSAVRRFDREMEPHLVDLLDLSRADITSKRPGRRQAALRSISELSLRIQALREADAVLPPLPSGIGDVVMQRFGLAPSRQIGDLKRALEVAVEAGTLEARREAGYYLPFVARLLGRDDEARALEAEVAPAAPEAERSGSPGAGSEADALEDEPDCVHEPPASGDDAALQRTSGEDPVAVAAQHGRAASQHEVGAEEARRGGGGGR